jgi:pimeloyl-ACP methyl ester carboxylesterase
MDVKANGLKLHYVEEGEGEPVVFLHGLTMDHTMYAAQFEELPDQFRCIALDQRGHGRSDCPPGPWSMQDCVNDAIAFIEAVDAAPSHLVGMSWGGMVALGVALQRPELARSMALIDTSADTDPKELADLERWYLDAIAEQGITDELIESSLPLLYGERYRSENAAGIEAHYDRLRSMKPEGIVEALRAITERESLIDRLSQITIPVLVVHGEADAAQPISEAEKIASRVAGAKLVRIPDAGHTTPIEAPDQVNAALNDFLGRAG